MMSADNTIILSGLKASAFRSRVLPKKTTVINLGTKTNIKPLSTNGIINGTVKEKGVPVSRRVFCYSRDNGVLVASTTSDANGAYQLSGLALNPDYYVVSLDENGDKVQYNAVIQDLIRAKKVIA